MRAITSVLILSFSCADAYLLAASKLLPEKRLLCKSLSRHVCNFLSESPIPTKMSATPYSQDNSQDSTDAKRKESGKLRGVKVASSPARNSRVSGRVARGNALLKGTASRQGLSRKDYALALSIAGEKAGGSSIKRQRELARFASHPIIQTMPRSKCYARHSLSLPAGLATLER